eukprot:g5207.t1
MIDLEADNLHRLAETKSGTIEEHFGRVQESTLQLQSFAGQAVIAEPETFVIDDYVTSVPGLNSGLAEKEITFDHSVWFIPGFTDTQVPDANDTVADLLDRSSLMDVPYRGMQRQHLLVYLAALDEPLVTGLDAHVNFQPYPGFNMNASGYADFGPNADCPGFPEYTGEFYDPRCRPWYQGAIQNENQGVIFTNPYVDAGSGSLIVTTAATVFNAAGTVLGVVGLDMDFDPIEASIKDLTVTGDEGYAYLLAPGGKGQVAVHRNLKEYSEEQYIVDLEEGFGDNEEEKEAFEALVVEMSESCDGAREYEMGGETWILAWEHEAVSGAASVESGSGDCGAGGYIVVVTVGEDVLLEVFSKTQNEIRYVVAAASAVMAALLLVIGCCTGGSARALSKSITEPVNQLVDVVHSLNRLDFSRKAAGTWMVNDVTSPEVEELMTAFEAMSTVVKFANIKLASGDVDIAQQNYTEAKVLFTKLGNDRGVSIVNNNLGNVYTLQARQLVAAAAETEEEKEPDHKAEAARLVQEAGLKFDDAVTSYRLAIDDAEMLCSGQNQLQEEGDGDDSENGLGSNNHNHNGGVLTPEGGEFKEGGQVTRLPSRADIEVGAVRAGATSRAASRVVSSHSHHPHADDDLSSPSALQLQLANRKLNLALCLAAKGNSAVRLGGSPDLNAINEARRLLHDCARLAADREDARGDQRHVECLIEVAKLGQEVGRHVEAAKALDAAESVVIGYHGSGSIGTAASTTCGGGAVRGGVSIGIKVPPPEGVKLPPPLAALRQQLLAARGAHCVASGNPAAAVEHWADAVIACGDRMDVGAVRSSLEGLRELARSGSPFPDALLLALGFRAEHVEAKRAFGRAELVEAVETALRRLDSAARKCANVADRVAPNATEVDLCFVMDCTRSMQSWIDQAKTKLVDIINQAKNDVSNLHLRVAFVGYRDFGDKVQYEGPYDFHTEADMPKLLSKLKHIRAKGGHDVPEDVAGGLKRAIEVSWKSPIRLCILIADAPCHGSIYHNYRDNYPAGCPKKLDPSKLLYTLQY